MSDLRLLNPGKPQPNPSAAWDGQKVEEAGFGPGQSVWLPATAARGKCPVDGSREHIASLQRLHHDGKGAHDLGS